MKIINISYLFLLISIATPYVFAMENPHKTSQGTSSSEETAIALRTAIVKHSNEDLERLLANPLINANEPDDNGNYPLSYAVSGYPGVSKAMIKMLLEKHADPTLGKAGGSALAVAIKKNNLELLKLLLQYVPKDKYENVPLMSEILSEAASKDKLEVLKLLLEYFPKNKHEYTYRALMRAIYRNDLEAFEELIPYANPNIEIDGNTPLIAAIRIGNPKMVEILLDADADVNMKDQHELTAMGWLKLGTTFLPGEKPAIREKIRAELINLLNRHGHK